MGVELLEEGLVEGFVAAGEEGELLGAAAGSRQGGGEFFQTPGGDGFAGEEPVDAGEAVGVEVVGVVVGAAVGDDAVERGAGLGLVTGVEDEEFLEVGEDGERRLGAVAVADGLEAIVGVAEVAGGLLGLDEEPGGFGVGGEREGVVGALAGGALLLTEARP